MSPRRCLPKSPSASHKKSFSDICLFPSKFSGKYSAYLLLANFSHFLRLSLPALKIKICISPGLNNSTSEEPLSPLAPHTEGVLKPSRFHASNISLLSKPSKIVDDSYQIFIHPESAELKCVYGCNLSKEGV